MDKKELIKLISFWAYKENKLHISSEDIKDLASFLINKLGG